MHARSIIHLDADAFFASVEQAADPRLRGRAIAVGGEKRGIIASASYEARRFGVYTPMPTLRARKLCPKLLVLPGDFDKYEQFSRWMFSYAYDFTPDVEITSIDEGYFDLTHQGKPVLEIAETLRKAIKESLKLTVSEGMGSNKLVSQIASKLHKPAAFGTVPSGQEKAFLHPLPNHWLPGIGPHTAKRLQTAGLISIGQIAQTPTDLLHLLLGKLALPIREFANGIDDRLITPANTPAKSYGQQQTFDTDQTDEVWIEALLRRMADRLASSVRADGKSIRTLTVKVRYNDMDEDQASETLQEPTDLETDLYPRIRPLLRRAWRRRVSLRLVALKLSNVYNALFRLELPLEAHSRLRANQRRIVEVIDRLRESHGKRVILRGHDFTLEKPPVDDTHLATALQQDIEKHKPLILNDAGLGYRRRKSTYIPLQLHSYYSFLDSTLSIRDMVRLGTSHEIPALAIADHGNLHGAFSFFREAERAGMHPILGVRVVYRRNPAWLYVQDAKGYQNLCRMLSSQTPRDTEKEEGSCAQQQRHLCLDLRNSDTEGLLAVSPDPSLIEYFQGRFYRAVRNRIELEKARRTPGIPAVLCTPVHYAVPEDRWKYDILQSIRTRTLLRQTHPDKAKAYPLHFRTPSQMETRCRKYPDLLAHTCEIAERCQFQFLKGPIQFPPFIPEDGSSSRDFLRDQVKHGLQRRYGTSAVRFRKQVDEELSIIHEVGYEDYFLLTWDLLRDCRKRDIPWITRGSAADSLVCYCLEISDVCPVRFDLYFRRFLNRDRMQLNKLPDIDIDFPHDCKDAVIDLIFEKFGTEHAAIVGGFSTYQARGAVGDVAKVLGVSEQQIRTLTKLFPHADATHITALLKERRECADLPLNEEPYRTALEMATLLDQFPRYPKMHPCGVVLSRQPMHELTATFTAHKGYPTTHYDMDDIEEIGLVKMDILAQGGLAVMRDTRNTLADQGIEIDLRAFTARFANGRSPSPSLSRRVRAIPKPVNLREPWQDTAVWDMLAGGGSRAVHHIESPAMVGLCKRCNVRDIDGLIAIVSVIRPGAANESKKLRFTLRYQGLEPVTYPHPCLEKCLRSTFGLVVYEEHVLQICEAFAGLNAGRADVLRRALGKEKQEVIHQIKGEFFEAARLKGHPEKTIEEVWSLVSGFAGYAFCKAHSTAYGVEAYESAWLKLYFPVEFMAAVLSNGKGFYHPLVYILECHRLGIPILSPSINDPGPAYSVIYGTHETVANDYAAIRVPLTRVKGLTDRTSEKILQERRQGPFTCFSDFYRRTHPAPEEIEALIRVGAFDEFDQTRTAQFWESRFLIQSLRHDGQYGQGWLLPPEDRKRLPDVPLEEPTHDARLKDETELLDFAVSGHPLDLYPQVAWDTYCPINRLKQHIGETIVTCGLVIEQRIHLQITGEAMKFMTLADWTGMVETDLFAQTYRSFGLASVRYPVLEVTATVEPYENHRGFSLRVHRAGRPRTQPETSLPW